ncbi:hypothetical protein [Rhizobium sp. MHM7A]|uniref:hypothetical protein n=1 Tax=Rhizobium sp. MHM7A TaxID=2583233 RepID=UPI001106E221|nr:hypothetical protein [Rhizobium sp. MHM7A]TLX15938.1 hypothetical protein FFR93_01075 [Rhizobium sp. MHM7A]
MSPSGLKTVVLARFTILDGVHAVCILYNEMRKTSGCQFGALLPPVTAIHTGIVLITVDVGYFGRIVVERQGSGHMSAEPMYREGRSEARHKALAADLDELLTVIDSLYGRDNIEDLSDVEAVREEALNQIDREFKNPASIGWDMVDVINADRGFGP